jgi:hypothetical protein
MQTVVNKEIEGPKFSRQGSKISTARTFYELPPVIKLLAHRDSNLLAPVMFDGWQVNAPELTGPVEVQGFQDEAGRDAMSNSGLDNYLGFQMADQTPDRPDKGGVAVIPMEKAKRPDLDAARGQRCRDRGPKACWFRARTARKADHQFGMEPRFPITVRLILIAWQSLFGGVAMVFVDPFPRSEWLRQDRAETTRGMTHNVPEGQTEHHNLEIAMNMVDFYNAFLRRGRAPCGGTAPSASRMRGQSCCIRHFPYAGPSEQRG